MYPQQELTRLADRKRVLRENISCHRIQCANAAARIAQPLEWVDRALAFWKRLSPLAQFAAVPLGWVVKRTLFPRLKILGTILRWSPVVFAAVRGLMSAAKNR
jgi:hypothetical protein